MRSTQAHRSSLLYAALPAAALVAILAACGDDSAGSRAAFDGDLGAPGANENAGQEPIANEFTTDAAAPPKDAYRGSPLCHLNVDTCDPDDDGTKSSSYAKPCAKVPDPEAGTASAPEGCRISGTGAIPACLEASPAGTDGTKCESGSECAPGFDCVVSGDAAYCRRYCCSGSCGTHRSQNGAETFCDVQTLADGTTTKAPVCMPIKTCKLFTMGECADNETCSVVTDDGTTGCVANGDAKAGEPCDTEHCSAGLTCLGQAGSRKCLQLCRTKTGPTCPTNQFCKTATIFPDPSIGVCAPTQ